MRQILTGLFAFYLIAIVLFPCADTCSSHEHDTPTTVQAAQDHHEQENDICSPFCICSCCGTSVTNVFFPSAFSAIFPVASQDFPVYHSPFIPEVYFNIWQPPKVG